MLLYKNFEDFKNKLGRRDTLIPTIKTDVGDLEVITSTVEIYNIATKKEVDEKIIELVGRKNFTSFAVKMKKEKCKDEMTGEKCDLRYFILTAKFDMTMDLDELYSDNEDDEEDELDEE